MDYYIASVSWGKDSTYMLLELIKRNFPLNEVVFYNTGMEFQAINDVRDRMLPLIKNYGIKKKQGLKKGVPDLCLPAARGKYHGLYIEMKKDNVVLFQKTA